MTLKIAEQLRAAHVRRWHIVQVAREQSLAEHLFCVAVISGALAARMRWPGLLSFDRKLQLLNWALWHDILEVRTGDTPTPFKRALEQVGGDNLFEKAEELIDNDVCGQYRMIKGTEIEMIVKIADLMEAVKYLGENALGAHARQVLGGIRSNLTDTVLEYDRKYPTLEVQKAVMQVAEEMGIGSGQT